MTDGTVGDQFLIDAELAVRLVEEEGALLVDLRGDLGLEKLGGERISGALTVNRLSLAAVETADTSVVRARVTAPDSTVVVFCATDEGSSRAVGVLREVGFRSVFHVRGGYPALRDALDGAPPTTSQC